MALMTAPWRTTGVAVAAGLLAASPAAAHPHVFIDYTVTLQFDDAGAAGVRLSWTFDEMYSSMLFHDYTSRPTHGPLSDADIKKLEEGAFKDTADYHYFIDMTLNGKPVPVTEVTGFTARFEQHRMTYSFTVPIRDRAPAGRNTLEIAAFDHEFYIDFELAKKAAVAVEHGEKLAAACAPKTERKNTSTFGPMDAVVVACTFGAS